MNEGKGLLIRVVGRDEEEEEEVLEGRESRRYIIY